MRLASSSLMVLSSLSLVLLSGCKSGTSLEKFVAKIKSQSAVHVVFTAKVDDKQQNVDVLLVRDTQGNPIRIRSTCGPYELAANEIDGAIEYDKDDKVYMKVPYTGRFYAGTGRVFPASLVAPTPVLANNPFNTVSKEKWKKEASGGNETWKTKVETGNGEVEVKIVLSPDGDLKEYHFGEQVQKIVSFEMMNGPDLKKFQLEIPSGYDAYSPEPEPFGLVYGAKWDHTLFQAKGKFANFKPSGYTLYGLMDPSASSSKLATTWMQTASKGITKVPVWAGDATDGLCDPKQLVIYKYANSTPTFVLTNKDGVIVGLWIGLTTASQPVMEKELQEIIGKSN